MQVKGLSEDSRSTLLSMTTEITYAEVRFKNEQPKSLGNASEAPVAPKEKTSTPKSNPGLLKLLLALVMILLLLTISFLIAFIIFFQKYSELIQEKQFKQETTHTILECKKEKLIMEGKSWSCCPKNWTTFNTSCYFISTESKKNWNESKKNCMKMQAHLLVINTKEEQEFINSNVKNNFLYYLGLSYLKEEDDWQWVDQTPYNKNATFWFPDEPSPGNEHCAVLQTRKRKWGLNNIPCTQDHASICEMLQIYL